MLPSGASFLRPAHTQHVTCTELPAEEQVLRDTEYVGTMADNQPKLVGPANISCAAAGE